MNIIPDEVYYSDEYDDSSVKCSLTVRNGKVNLSLNVVISEKVKKDLCRSVDQCTLSFINYDELRWNLGEYWHYFNWNYDENVDLVGWYWFKDDFRQVPLSVDRIVYDAIETALKKEDEMYYNYWYKSIGYLVRMRGVMWCIPRILAWKWRAVHKCWTPPNGLGFINLKRKYEN